MGLQEPRQDPTEAPRAQPRAVARRAQFGGFAHGAVRHLRALAARDIADRTEYCEGETAANFVTHHAQRISAAIVTGDARRCLNRIPGLQQLAAFAASAAVTVGGATRRRRA